MAVPALSLLLLAAPTSRAAVKAEGPAKPPEVRIVRKPGKTTGIAQVTLNGRTRNLSGKATAVWLVQAGAGALAILDRGGAKTPATPCLLRYFDLNQGKGRDLGRLPFCTGALHENGVEGAGWSFALTGNLPAGGSAILVGGTQAIPGYVANATLSSFDADGLHFRTSAGEEKIARTDVLLGTSLDAIYTTPQPPAQDTSTPRLLQVSPDGSSLQVMRDNEARPGTWHTDGTTLTLTSGSHTYGASLEQLQKLKGIPAGTRFSVRLTAPLSTHKVHVGDPVQATLIAPVVVEDEILAPMRSVVEGKIVQAASVGWGFKHASASLTIAWSDLRLPDGRTLPLSARVAEVENSEEKVTPKGKIQRKRATATPGHSVENGVLTFAGIDPVAYTFATISGNAVLGFAEAEILYPSGTEMLLQVNEPALTSEVYAPAIHIATPAEAPDLGRVVRNLPFRTKTKVGNKDSDLTNLVFVGSPEALQRAFSAAGWQPTDELYAASTFRTLKTLSGNQTYTQAPMSILTLEGREPLFTLNKTTNTFSSRHHLRVFATGEKLADQPVLTASSTQDIAIAFSAKQKTFIHVIDEHVDNERAKIVNDLEFTGCVDRLAMVDRPWIPHGAYNSTGDRLITDGKAAVLFFNGCSQPEGGKPEAAKPPNRFERSTRNTSLTIRDSLYRGNLIYQGIAGGFKVHDFLKSQKELPADQGSWRKTDATGTEYQTLSPEHPPLLARPHSTGVSSNDESLPALSQQTRETHRWDPPRYEFAIQGGYLHMRPSYLSAVGVLELSSEPNKDAYFLFLADDVGDGWAAGGSVTVNSWKHFSNEFSYFRQQVKYQLQSVNAVVPPGQDVILDDSDLESDRIGLVTRQFEYNVLIHPTRPTSRWRPYAAVGPVLQLVALNGAPLKKPAGVYTLGLKNIGLIKAAFDFGNTPPLDGGGIFHIGFQYGGGIKFRATPRTMLRADWRETWAKNPDIIANSYEDYDPNDLDETYTTQIIRVGPEKKFIKERFTLGVAFTF